MLITLLTPTLNCAPFLANALDSAEKLARLLPGRVQHLIGDAGSTDGTFERLQSYAAVNSWAALHQFPKMSIPATLNRLVREAAGDWIVVLNGDDELMPDALAQCLLRRRPDRRIVCGDILLLTREGEVLGKRSCELPGMHRAMAANHAAIATARSCFDVVGSFDESCPTSYDYEWLWRSMRSGVPFEHEPQTLATFRLGGLGSRRRMRSNFEIARAKIDAGYWFEGVRYYTANTLKRGLNNAGLDPGHWLMALGRKMTRSPVTIIPKQRRYPYRPGPGALPDAAGARR